MRFAILLFIILCSFQARAQLLDVEIFSDYTTEAINIVTKKGKYNYIGDSTLNLRTQKGEAVLIKSENDQVVAYSNGKKLYSGDSINVYSEHQSAIVQMDCKDLRLYAREYQGNFIFYVHKGSLRVINTIEIQRYLAGVVETEGGINKPLEFYKVQSVISRTFALVHRYRHSYEDFNLCDGIHCQAYKSRLKHTPEIREAVKATADTVIVGNNNKMINGYFSANCGGQTSETDWIWNKKISYLPSVKDTFCTKSWQADWKKSLSQWKWKQFLVKNYDFPVDDPQYQKSLYRFDQNKRQIFYGPPELGIPLHEIRSHFNLKSTFFSVRSKGSKVILSGHGYGHGIGMCQEGAMGMAEHGYSYHEIIKYYYRPIRLIDYYWLIYWNF